MRFFIVEDEPELLDLNVEIVQLCGHSVAGTARNGAEALEKLAGMASAPDIILMDHRMPVLTGMEATRKIMRLNPRARVVIASADESVEEEARSLGVMEFMLKPFSVDRLMDKIRKIEMQLEGSGIK